MPRRVCVLAAARLLDDARRSALLPRPRALARRGPKERRPPPCLRRGRGPGLRSGGRLDDDRLRRSWMLLNFSTAILVGFLVGGWLGKDLSPLDEINFRDWMLPRLLDDGGLTCRL